MSVKKESSGRRSREIEFEVPGTAEEVWRAIATGPGVASWLVPAVFEERNGKPVTLKLSFAAGMEASSEITAWNPPRMFATKADGWLPGSPPIASEWSVEARDGGVCVVRIVQSLFASTDEWDMQLEAAKGGLSSFLEILRIYLTHFRGQQSALKQWSAPAPGTEAASWGVFTSALGLKGMRVGQRFIAPAGAPPLSGVVEYVTENPYDAVLRIDQPAPGVAALGIAGYPGGPIMVAMNFYLYGNKGPATLARETPRWDAWMQDRFPAPVESGKRD